MYIQEPALITTSLTAKCSSCREEHNAASLRKDSKNPTDREHSCLHVAVTDYVTVKSFFFMLSSGRSRLCTCFMLMDIIYEEFSMDVFIHVEIQSASSLQTLWVKIDLFRLGWDYTGVVRAGEALVGGSRRLSISLVTSEEPDLSKN